MLIEIPESNKNILMVAESQADTRIKKGILTRAEYLIKGVA